MKARIITFKLVLELPDNITHVAFSRDGKLLTFMDIPKLHAITDWSNYMLVNSHLNISNYKDTTRSVK